MYWSAYEPLRLRGLRVKVSPVLQTFGNRFELEKQTIITSLRSYDLADSDT